MKKILYNISTAMQVKPSKILLFILIGFFSTNSLWAQTQERKWNIGLLGGFSVYAGDLGNSMTDFTYSVFRQNPTAGLNLTRYLSPSFDVSLNTTIGSWGYYKNYQTVFKGTMAHANLNLKYKFNNGYLLAEDARMAPYLFAGAGLTNLTGDRINSSIDYPIVGGIGVRLKLSSSFCLVYQATYGYMSTAHNNPQSTLLAPTGNDKFMLHMVGITFNLGDGVDSDKDGVSDKKDKCPETPENVKVDKNGCPIDTDGDGVPDYEDACINELGSAQTKGCPDTDKDGVADKDDQCPNEPGTMATFGCPDTDGDGIIDSKDKCVNQKGSIAMEGCPDRDGDGVADAEDNCPDVKGLAQFKGCPDTDGDGIIDGLDACPDKSGPASTNGCPDTDGDGVHDGIDQCVKVPGPASNNGCPVLKKEVTQLFQKALQGIQFETGKATIKPLSFGILNAIVKVMKENPSYKLFIAGHTDNVGEDEMNMTLSKERAASVANYLIKGGVDPLRISSEGFGETKPVDTNDTPKGRTLNRRVEFKVEFLEVVN